MSQLRQFLILGLLSTTPMHSQTAAPTAPRIEHRETRHGATVIDPYFWLREKSNPQVAQYLERENAYTEALTRNLKPFSDAIYQEMLGHIKQTDLSVPTRRGEYRSEEHTSELQSLRHLVCRLLLEKKKKAAVCGRARVGDVPGPRSSAAGRGA